MFKRELQVKVVKPTKKVDGETETPETEVDDKVEIFAHVIDKSITKISITVCTFVVLDTIRKVLVARASK